MTKRETNLWYEYDKYNNTTYTINKKKKRQILYWIGLRKHTPEHPPSQEGEMGQECRTMYYRINMKIE